MRILLIVVSINLFSGCKSWFDYQSDFLILFPIQLSFECKNYFEKSDKNYPKNLCHFNYDGASDYDLIMLDAQLWKNIADVSASYSYGERQRIISEIYLLGYGQNSATKQPWRESELRDERGFELYFWLRRNLLVPRLKAHGIEVPYP